jgi:hypothetical protein
MTKWLMTLAGLSLVACAAWATDPPGWVGTGDRGLDGTLKQIEAQAQSDQDGFFAHISTRFGVPEADIRQARETHRLGPADVFMAAALARVTQRPMLAIAERYAKNRGRGWGVVAKEMGIKPGSPAFHELKKGASGSVSHLKAVRRERQRHEEQARREHEKQAKAQGRSKGPGKSR